MPRIGLPTADLGETHSLQKARKPAELSFCHILHVRFGRFVRFVRFARFVYCVRFVSFFSFVECNEPSKRIFLHVLCSDFSFFKVVFRKVASNHKLPYGPTLVMSFNGKLPIFNNFQ